MRNMLDRELQQLNEEILRMGGLVEDAVDQCIIVLRERNIDLARTIISRDDQIDHLETKIEKHCLSLFALQQPLAADLRLIGASLKMLTDLERIADHASDIAELTIRLAGTPALAVPNGIFQMAEKTRNMLRMALDAFVRQDTALADAVCKADDEVDDMFTGLVLDRVNVMKADASKVEASIDMMFIVKYLERMGDHATNIAEWVIYNTTGQHGHLQHPEAHPERERLDREDG